VLFAIYIIAMNLYDAHKGWYRYGGGAPRSPLYGIWSVDSMTIDGVIRAPLVTDWDRWRRIVFDTRARMGFQRMDDSFVFYTAKFDDKSNTLTVTSGAAKEPLAIFTVAHRAADQMTLAGSMDDHNVEMGLQLVERNRYPLISRGFHWVQEYPFNR
jgi:hypothetical protein